MAVKLYKDGKETRVYVHRLVANAFLENPMKYKTVSFKDKNKQNIKSDNLQWGNGSKYKY